MVSCRVIVSGFDWYRGQGYTIYYPNPSSLVVEALNGSIVEDCSVKGIVLNVDYSIVKDLWRLLEEYEPDIVIGLGLHPRTDEPLIELSAINYGFRRLDENVYSKYLFEEGEPVAMLPVDHVELLKYLWSRGFKVSPSNTLGLYLCNAVAYTYYRYARTRGKYAVFIHIPPVGDLRIRLKLDVKCSWNIQLLVELVKVIIGYFKKNLERT